MQPGALHLNGLWSRLMDRTGGGWFLITLYTETKDPEVMTCVSTCAFSTLYVLTGTHVVLC